MRVVALVALALAAAMASVAVAAGEARPSLDVEYGGCRDVVRGACVIDSAGKLRLWIRTDADAAIEVAVDGEPAKSDESVEIQGGQRHVLAIAGAGRATVRAVRGGASTEWSVALAQDTRHDLVKRAAAALSAGNVDDARDLVAPLAATDTDALGLLGRIQNLAGETDAARATLRAAVARQLASGHSLAAVKDATVLAYSLMLKGRHFGEARAVLGSVAGARDPSAEERYFLAYFRGLLSYNSGDDRGTLRDLGTAADEAARMGWDRLQVTAEQTLAVQLQMLGRRDEAAALMSAWQDRLDVLPNDCERAMFLNNVGWTRLLALEAGEPAADPLPPLEQAYAIFSGPAGGGLCNADEQVNGLLNLALAQLHAGRTDLVASYLERAHRTTETPELRMVLWSLDIDSRLALLQGHADDALERAEELRALGEATVSPDAVWRGVVRAAAAYEHLDRRADALAAYAEAERLLDGQLFRVPVSEGRETLLAAHEWATQRHLSLLLDDGRIADALALARRASARALSSLRPAGRVHALAGAERARWDAAIARYLTLRDELTALSRLGWMSPRDELERITAQHAQRERELDAILDDALATLGPPDREEAPAELADGTFEIVFHRIVDGWVVFAADAQGVRAHRPACATNEGVDLATCLIAPLMPALARAERVRMLPGEELREVDFHALAAGEDVLLARAPVVYGLDMPPLAPPAAARRALLVGDAQGNLAAAQEELRVVRDALDSGGEPWRVTLLRSADATLERVRPALADVELFHYAGHARSLGARGWDSELQLGGRTVLDVGDVLALERAPDIVVLSGCETAATEAASEAGGISLAQAFLASGARTVVATTRPVRDTTALAVMQRFYDQWLGGAAPEVALQRAQMAVRRETADADWAAFRIIER